MGLFNRTNKAPEPVGPEPEPQGKPKGPQKKNAPTPTRRQAEAARMQRLNPQLSGKEAKKKNAAEQRRRSMEARTAMHDTPEKNLMRDVIDSRWGLGEFLLPAMFLMLALTFLQQVWAQMAFVSLAMMYTFLALVILDFFLIWRKFRKIQLERHPEWNLKGKGVRMYGFNRAIQMRPLRAPKPVVSRGAKL